MAGRRAITEAIVDEIDDVIDLDNLDDDDVQEALELAYQMQL